MTKNNKRKMSKRFDEAEVQRAIEDKASGLQDLRSDLEKSLNEKQAKSLKECTNNPRTCPRKKAGTAPLCAYCVKQ